MPDITGSTWLIEAFYELSTTRSYTMGGAARIPVDRIWAWEERYGAPIWFCDAIMSIDSTWLGAMSNG